MMITAERIEALKALGYYIEDMGEEYGEDWIGQFRWMNDEREEFQDGCTSDSEADAWASAETHNAEWLAQAV